MPANTDRASRQSWGTLAGTSSDLPPELLQILSQLLARQAVTAPSTVRPGEPPITAFQPALNLLGSAILGKRANEQERQDQAALGQLLAQASGPVDFPLNGPGAPQGLPGGLAGVAMGADMAGQRLTGQRSRTDQEVVALLSGHPAGQRVANRFLAGQLERRFNPPEQWAPLPGPRGSLIQRNSRTGELKQVVAQANPLETLLGLQFAGGTEKDSNAPWKNIVDPKKRDEARIRFGADADRRISVLHEEVDKSKGMVQSLDRFLYLNQRNPTGALYKFPGSQALAGFSDELAEMRSITDLLTPAMRQGMPGAASDRDVAMFRGATVGLDKPLETNQSVAMGLKTAHQNKIDRTEFMADYVARHGHDRGADTEWKKYLNANPIFAPNAKPGSYTLNENRMDYRTFFDRSRKEVPTPGVAPKETPKPGSDPLGLR